MDTQAELREIFSHVKSLLRSYEEMGLGPPPIRIGTPNVSKKGEPGRGRTTVSAHREDEEALASARPASLHDLRKHIGDCKRCKLHKSRTHLVFGEGSSHAKLVFVGEGPGHDEDMAGRPFVGESGKLLTKIIENGMGLTRKDVYICNVVKCHPPRNRDPEADEIGACIQFLKEQLRIIGPEVICTLGRVASQALLGSDFRISEERGRWRSYENIALMPTYHPAYLLRNPSAKRQVWEDIKKIMKRIGLEVKTDG